MLNFLSKFLCLPFRMSPIDYQEIDVGQPIRFSSHYLSGLLKFSNLSVLCFPLLFLNAYAAENDGPDNFAATPSTVAPRETVTLTWEPVGPSSLDVYYLVYYYAPGDTKLKFIDFAFGTSITHRPDQIGQYTYLVQAFHDLYSVDDNGLATVKVNVQIPDIRITSAPTVSSPVIHRSRIQSVSWTEATESVTSYELYRNNSRVYSGPARSASVRSASLGGGEVGTDVYKVRGCRGTACGNFSPVTNVVVYSTPRAPTNIRVNTPVTDKGNVTLRWDAAAGVVQGHYYNVYGTQPGGQDVFLARVNGLSHTRQVNGIGIHSFRVNACNINNTCGISTGPIRVNVTPSKVSSLSAPSFAPLNSQFTVSWPAVTGNVERYVLRVNGRNASVGNVLQATVSETAQVGAVTVRVAACNNSSGCGPFSDVKSVNVYAKPTAPVNSRINGVRGTPNAGDVIVGNDVDISWTPPANAVPATTYSIRVRTPAGDEPLIAEGIKSVTFKHLVDQIGQYRYRIFACDAALGCSSVFINVNAVAPVIGTSGTPFVSTTSRYLLVNQPYTLSWPATSGAVNSYELFENGLSVYQGTQRSHRLTNSISGEYSYAVRACYSPDICGELSPLLQTEVLDVVSTTTVNNDTYAFPEVRNADLSFELDVLANDVDQSHPSLRLELVSTSSNNGQPIRLNSTGKKVIYRASATDNRPDTFSYRVINSRRQLSRVANVNLTFFEPEDPPIAVDDRYYIEPRANCNGGTPEVDIAYRLEHCRYALGNLLSNDVDNGPQTDLRFGRFFLLSQPRDTIRLRGVDFYPTNHGLLIINALGDADFIAEPGTFRGGLSISDYTIRDQRGGGFESQTALIFVRADNSNNDAPSVNPTFPQPEGEYSTSTPITVTASAVDTDGSIQTVEVSDDEGKTWLPTQGTNYSLNLGFKPAGTHTILYRAIDNLGRYSPVETVTFHMIQNTNPEILTAVISSAEPYTIATNIVAEATATDSDGTVDSVEFRLGEGDWLVDATAPFRAEFGTLHIGSHTIEYRARDNLGDLSATVSQTINVIAIPNATPTVSFVSPSEGASYVTYESVFALATALDSDGRIVSVDFRVDEGPWRPVTQTPYELDLGQLSTGAHTIEVRSRDNDGEYSPIAVRNVVVTAPPRRIIYIHTDALGSPASETNEQGEQQ